MEILAHRGLWKEAGDRNSFFALQNAFAAGYGIETDIRDYCGELVISHDVARNENLTLNDVLREYSQTEMKTTLALNIKADGLQGLLRAKLEKYQIEKQNYFLFDMSVPEQVVYLKQGFSTFCRQSEYERDPALYNLSAGVWMDEFSEPWIEKQIILRHLEHGKKVGIISPEIHGNNVERIWQILKDIESDDIMLCTDMSKRAEEYFYGAN